MRLLVERSDELPLVSGYLAFPAGATLDPIGKEGLARLTARMLRRGAAGRSARWIEERLDSLGAELSAEASMSHLVLSFQVLARHVDDLVDLLSLLVSQPTFDPEEFAKLKRETEAELVESRENDRVLASRALRKTLFDGHPYGRRASGTLPSLVAIERDDVSRFHREHLTQQAAVIALVGDLAPGQEERLARKLVEALPEGSTPVDLVQEPQPSPGRRLVFVEKPERTQTQLLIGCLGIRPHEEEFAPLSLSVTAFGGTFTSRLMREVRSKRGWSYGASARLGMEPHRELFVMSTAPATKDTAACLALELQLLEQWQTEGLKTSELSFAKRFVRRSRVFEVDTASKRVHQKLDALLLGLPEGFHDRWHERAAQATLEQCTQAARAWIDPSSVVVALVGSREELGAAVRDAIPGLQQELHLPFDHE